MTFDAIIDRFDRAAKLRLAGGVASVVVAALLFSRVGIDGYLYRDEAIYAYGGQQMLHGVAPYASIFDPKAPMATMLCGIAAGIGHLLGVNDLTMIRVVFYVLAVLTSLAIYVLVLQLWQAVLGGVVAAVVFSSFRGFAQDALRGPDAKTPAVLFAVLAMWLGLRRQWFWAAFAGSMAFLVWQPLIVYPVVVMGAAVLYTKESRWRALAWSSAGAAIPILVTLIYFAAEGAVRKFVEAAFVFPLRGLHRAHSETVPQRLGHIARVVSRQYKFSGVLLWVGLALLIVVLIASIVVARADWRSALISPLMLIVALTGLSQWAYTSLDFQSYEDVYPLLPYSAVGIGAAVALVARRVDRPVLLRALTAGTLAAGVALTVLSWSWFSNARDNNHYLPAQRAMGCALNRIVVPGTRLYSIGDPVPLVLTHRRNPDRYIYLESNVAEWKVKHTRGGFDGWVSQVTSSNSSVVVLQGWMGTRVDPMRFALFRAGYEPRYLGKWSLLVTHEALRRARAEEIGLSRHATRWPRTTDRERFLIESCGDG